MSQPFSIPPPGFEKLSVDEQVEYIDGLLDYAASQQEHLRIPEWHLEILNARLANYREDLAAGKNWEQFEKELENELTRT